MICRSLLVGWYRTYSIKIQPHCLRFVDYVQRLNDQKNCFYSFFVNQKKSLRRLKQLSAIRRDLSIFYSSLQFQRIFMPTDVRCVKISLDRNLIGGSSIYIWFFYRYSLWQLRPEGFQRTREHEKSVYPWKNSKKAAIHLRQFSNTMTFPSTKTRIFHSLVNTTTWI